MSSLTGVPETMLWTLHNRASEAEKPDGYLKDDLCLKIYREIDYNYESSFGKADGVHGCRSKVFDEAVLEYLEQHEEGTVVELGAGLETQFFRVDNGAVNWFVVDVPDAIEVRKKYIPENDRLINISKSALDFTWMEDIPKEVTEAFISCQGLLMYFEEEQVKLLLTNLKDRFPKLTLMFDAIPSWFSNKTMNGFDLTPTYRAPKMPWGINRNRVRPVLNGWLGSKNISTFEIYNFYLRGVVGFLYYYIFQRLPIFKRYTAGMYLVTIDST